MANDPVPAGSEPAGNDNPTPPPQQPEPAEAPAPATAAEALASEALQAAEQAAANLRAETGEGAAAGASPLTMPDFAPAAKNGAAAGAAEGIDLLADVNLNVKIELGRTRMLVEDVLRLGEGSVVELDKLAGDPVDIYVNDRPVARGEVLVLNDNFCVRINEILAAGEE